MSSKAQLRERIIAKALYRALKRNKDAMVIGGASSETETLIDGKFRISSLARAIDGALIRQEMTCTRADEHLSDEPSLTRKGHKSHADQERY